jgi:transglutaminase-like putative cysteine protease
VTISDEKLERLREAVAFAQNEDGFFVDPLCEAADDVAELLDDHAAMRTERDAARATVERVRALAVYLRDNGRNYSERDTARRVTADMIEAALTPPGDGGGA